MVDATISRARGRFRPGELGSGLSQTPARAPETATQLPMPAPRAADRVVAPKTRTDVNTEMEKALDKQYSGDPSGKEAARNAMSALDARLDAEDKLAAINQRTMVIPAPADFRPEPVARKVRLNLILEKSKIRAGESPRFRLELTNVGRETIDYQEYESSIFKSGSILNSLRTVHFYLTDLEGKRVKLHPALGTGRADPIRYHAATPESEREMQEINALGQASTTFSVKLQPGDSLRSLGDGNSAQEPFRTLAVQGGFKKPGAYQLRVELDDRPRPLTKVLIDSMRRLGNTLENIRELHDQEMKQALGPVSSDAAIEVSP